MKEIEIEDKDANQRLDKYLKRYLKAADSGFIYKMLRKKNIKLNGLKASGSEILTKGDVISIYFSDETLDRFTGGQDKSTDMSGVPSLKADEILYEDKDVIIMDKPAGELTQKSDIKDISLNDRMLKYLSLKGEWTSGDIYTPSVINRLDRNTSGIVIAGKTLKGLQLFSELVRDRSIRKYYETEVEGDISALSSDADADGFVHVKAYLKKDKRTNRVRVFDDEIVGSKPILMAYRVLDDGAGLLSKNCSEDRGKRSEITTPVEIELITGKTHQIRAHLSHMGYPIAGDVKYGSSVKRHYYLRAYKIVLPNDDRLSEELKGKVIETT